MKKIPSTHLRLAFVNVVVLFSLTGCATKQMELTKTGFLSGYSDLKEDEASKGMHVYKNPNVNIGARYSKILIAPIQFKLDPTVKAHEMKDKDREKLTDYFYGQLEERLSENYGIVNVPGEDVLIFRTAITDVLPNKVYLNLHWSTTLIGAGVGGASLEAELVDSMTGERMLSFVDGRKGRRLNYTKGLTKWGHTQEVLGIWADAMVMNLDQLREEHRIESMQVRKPISEVGLGAL